MQPGLRKGVERFAGADAAGEGGPQQRNATALGGAGNAATVAPCTPHLSDEILGRCGDEIRNNKLQCLDTVVRVANIPLKQINHTRQKTWQDDGIEPSDRVDPLAEAWCCRGHVRRRAAAGMRFLQ
jgi:hypothetical protein